MIQTDEPGLAVFYGKNDTGTLAHGVRELWTVDRDFGRFPALATSNPLTP
jgi:hypothetical protein